MAIFVVAIIGMMLSAYAVTLHYSEGESKLCDINSTFNCNSVNKSPWAVFLGVPVAIWGFVAYAVVFLTLLKRRLLEHRLSFTAKDFWQYFLYIALFMLAFQAYLTLTEVVFIKALCIVCLASQACTIIIAWFAWKHYRA
jgi:uncharacterized membrane protein